jgi:hypothetical protein
VGPFEFTITLLSFVYSLAITHLLLGVARIVRHRRTIRLSAAHLLWVANVFVVSILNWVTLWDFRAMRELSLGTIASATMFAVLLFLIATFVTADVESPEDRDLKAFHDRESPTYIGGLLGGAILALGLNLGAGALGIASWANQNALLLASLIPLVLSLIIRRGWLHLAAAAASVGFGIAFLTIYYPALR